MDTKEQIFEYIQKNQPVSPGVILEHVSIGEQMLYRHLKQLLGDARIKKLGSSPKVFYRIATPTTYQDIELDTETNTLLDDHFYLSLIHI